MLLAALLTLLAAPGGAETPYFRTVLPLPDGSWQITFGGLDSRSAPTAELWVDGTRVEVGSEKVASESRRRMPAPPEGARRLELRVRGQRVAALDLEPLDETHSAMASWTIYQVMLEMFANGDAGNDGQIRGWRHPRYAGGDLQGVLDRADYLRDLGVTAVWLSPVFQSQTSHGYDVQNYYRIGDAVGVPENPDASLALFRRLRDELAARGIRIILDIPLNHASRVYDREHGDPLVLHPKATGAKQPAEKTWESWGASYQYWNFDHAATREFLKQAALYWLRDEKVDGLRLDYVRGVPHDFWADLYRVAKEAKKGAFLVGECWDDAAGPEANAKEIASYYAEVEGLGPQFDSLLDFPLQSVLNDTFAGQGSLADTEAWLQRTAATYGPGALPTYFLDNHDLARFADRGGDRAHLLAALGYLVSLDGPVVLFYGTETGLGGGDAKEGFTDSGRLPMPWSTLDRELVGQTSAILKARIAHPALSSGVRLPLLVEDRVLVVAKKDGAETLLVGVNLGEAGREVVLEATALLPGNRELPPIVGAAPAHTDSEGRLTWTLPPRSTSIVALAPLPPS